MFEFNNSTTEAANNAGRKADRATAQRKADARRGRSTVTVDHLKATRKTGSRWNGKVQG
jgi:hypothetical protein